MDYLDNCDDVCELHCLLVFNSIANFILIIGSFIHMSPIHLYQDTPEDSDDTVILEYIYDIGFGDPEEFLKQLLGADEKGTYYFLNIPLLETLICLLYHNKHQYQNYQH